MTILFGDRIDAGRQLAAALAARTSPVPLVLGIPRGGVPVAAEVARALGADLDILVARKIGSPFSPEFAVGAVTADGGTILNEDTVDMLGLPEQWLADATARTVAEGRENRLRGRAPVQPVAGREVLLVDDGLATGSTMRAAVRCLRARGARRVVVAVPVGSEQPCAELRREADEVVCLQVPPFLRAVGQHHEDFMPIEDAEVTCQLEKFASRGRAHTADRGR